MRTKPSLVEPIIVRNGREVAVTMAQEYDAQLLEKGLHDCELLAVVLITAALRQLPDKACLPALQMAVALVNDRKKSMTHPT